MKSRVLSVLVGLLVACAGPRAPSRESWVARGNATLESDPGRALANYDRAGTAADPAKRREAALRWIRRELEQRRAKPGNPHADLSFVVDARRHAREREVEPQLAGELDAAEAALSRAWWQDELANIASRAPTPLEQIEILDAVRAALPPSAHATRSAAEVEVKARRVKLFASYEQMRAEAYANPAAQAVYETLTAALQGTSPDRDKRERIARNARASFVVTKEGCDELRGVTAAVRGGSGAHQVSIHVVGSCSANESSRTYTDVERWTETDTEEYWATEYETQCTSNYEAPTCTQRRYDGAYNGECVRTSSNSSQSCQKVPKQVRKTRTISVPHSETYTVNERTLSAVVSGTYVVRIDGVEQRIPFEVPLSITEKAYSRRDGSSSFSRLTPPQVIDKLVSGPLTEEVQALAKRIEGELLAAHVATARTKLAAGDVRGAEAEVAIALFAGAPPLDAAFAPLAERAGMPLATYTQTLRDGTFAQSRKFGLAGAALTVPKPDQDLVEAAEQAAIARQADEQQRNSNEVAAYYIDKRASMIGIGLDRWTTLDDTSSHGVTFLWGSQRGGGGMGRFWLYEHATVLDLNVGQPGLGLDAHARLGGGLRHPWVSLAGYGVAGLSRRGSTASGDPGLPFSLDAGYGIQLVLGTTRSRRVELMAERLLRPLVEEPAMGMGEMGTDVIVQQRLRYELRYVSSHFIGDKSGGRAWCSFDQTSTDDALFVNAPTTTRVCILAMFVAY